MKLPHVDDEPMVNESFPNDSLFFIDLFDTLVWGCPVISPDPVFFILNYPVMSINAYTIKLNNTSFIDDTLYHSEVDLILHRCLVHEEVE
jgi:hypothetical protein